MEHQHAQHVKLLITIVDRGKGQKVVNLLSRHDVVFHRIMLGRGTARTEILDLLGIGDPARDIVLSALPESVAQEALRRLNRAMQLKNPGQGIAFTLPIGSIGGQRALALLGADKPAASPSGKEPTMENVQFDLIISIVNKGYADRVMDAALPAGAQGGTVVHARGAGAKEAEKFFAITIQPEKEMVLILAHREKKRAIMEAICHEAGLNTEGHGIVFSVPAGDVMGAPRMTRDTDEDEEI